MAKPFSIINKRREALMYLRSAAVSAWYLAMKGRGFEHQAGYMGGRAIAINRQPERLTSWAYLVILLSQRVCGKSQ